MIASGVTAEAEAGVIVLEQARAGNEVAFARIVDAYHADMARIAYLVCGDLAIAEEAEQAAWAKVWRRLGEVRDPRRLRQWLVSVCVNEARQLSRSQRRRTVREISVATRAAWDDPDQAALIDLANALSRLEPRDRALIALKYMADFDSAQIGRAVGLSASGVRVRLSRLLDRLREDLGND